jgi:hypothetical protein
VKVPDPTNPSVLLTELDVLMKYAVVEIKTGKDIVSPRQIKNQTSLGQTSLGLPVLVYAPQATAYDLSEIGRLGAHGFTNLDLLLTALEQIKKESVKSTIRFDQSKQP